MKLVLFINYLAQKNNYAFLLKKERNKEAYYYKIFLISRYWVKKTLVHGMSMEDSVYFPAFQQKPCSCSICHNLF